MRNLYSILGVDKEADQAEIRKAFRKLARKYHPDVSKEKGAETKFKEINAAYEVLSDEQRRSWYDQFGEASLKTGFNPDLARQYGNQGPTYDSFEDLFSSFRSGAWSQPGFAERKGPDIESTIQIDLLTAINGGEAVVPIRRPETCASCGGSGGIGKKTCPKCKGQGSVTEGRFGIRASVLCDQCAGSGFVFKQECIICAGSGRVTITKTLKIQIPKDITEGKVIRLQGQGGEGHHGGRRGNLLVTIQFIEHPIFKKVDDNLELELPVTISEAIGGANITIPTPDGEIKITIPKDSNNGQRLRIKGRGAPSKNGRGDLFVIIRPQMPNFNEHSLECAKMMDIDYTTDVRNRLKSG